jgi:hypothetical protein
LLFVSDYADCLIHAEAEHRTWLEKAGFFSMRQCAPAAKIFELSPEDSPRVGSRLKADRGQSSALIHNCKVKIAETCDRNDPIKNRFVERFI